MSPPSNEEREKNTRKYIGVRKRRSGKWGAVIGDPSKRKRIWLGTFNEPEEAARAYDEASIRIHGRHHAILNFPSLPSLSAPPQPASQPQPPPKVEVVTATMPYPPPFPIQGSYDNESTRSIYDGIVKFMADYRRRHEEQEEYIKRVNLQLVDLQLPSLNALMEPSMTPFSNNESESGDSEFLPSTSEQS